MRNFCIRLAVSTVVFVTGAAHMAMATPEVRDSSTNAYHDRSDTAGSNRLACNGRDDCGTATGGPSGGLVGSS